MKKSILKIASLFVITFALIFGFNFNVEAVSISGNYLYYGSSGLELSQGERATVKYSMYGKDAYCMDAQYTSSTANVENVTSIDATGIYYPEYEAGIIAIVPASGTSYDGDYLARMIALRAWGYVFGRQTTGGAWHDALNANIKLAREWLQNDTVKSKAAQLGIQLAELPNVSGPSYSGNAVAQGFNYFVAAFDAAIARKNSKSNTTASDSQKIDSSIVEYEEDGVTRVKRDITHTFRLSNANDNSTFRILRKDSQYSSYGIQFSKAIPAPLVANISKIEIENVVIANSKEEVLNYLNNNSNLIDVYRSKGGTVSDNLIIKVTAHFEGKKEDLLKNCVGRSINYSIVADYGSSSSSSNDNCHVNFWRANGVGTQTYVTVDCDGNPTTTPTKIVDSPNTVSLVENCENPCEDLEKKCKDGDEAACKEYFDKDCPNDCTILDKVCDKDTIDPEFEEVCKDYDKVCPKDECDTLRQECGADIHADTEACEKYREVCFPSLADYKCNSYISGLACCDKDNNLIVGEEDNVPVNIVGPGPLNEDEPNLKLCFVDKVDNVAKFLTNENLDSVSDQNGNTYTFGGTKSNPYCTVSCKEDYMMQMPAAKKVNAGRYFTFKAAINGTKSCFTNSIDQKKFVEDITRLQDELIAASNEYQKYKTLLESQPSVPKEKYTSSCSCSGCSCSSTESTYEPSVTFYGMAKYTDVVERRFGSFTVRNITKYVEESHPLETLNSNGVETTSGESCSKNNEGKEVCSPCGDECESYTVDQPFCDMDCIIAKMINKRDSAKSTMDARNIEIKNLITLFNQCSSWSTAVKFDPKVRYEYQEDYMQMLINDKLTDNMEKEGQSVTNTSKWYCNYDEYPSSTPANDVTINNDYTECINGVVTGGIANIGDNIINTDNSNNNDNEPRENIFIGDSRTYYLFQQVNELTQDNTIACSGRGYGWFTNNGESEASDLPCVPGSSPYGGISSLEARLNSAKKYNVVVWLGVNDLGTDRLAGRTPKAMADLYIEQYKKLLNEHDNINIYVVSVGPVNELGETYGQTNAQVAAFNAELRSQIGTTPRLNYIDVYNTVIPEYIDGLHYEGQTNQRYYQAIKNGLKGDTFNQVENNDVTFDRQSDAKYRKIEVTQCTADAGCGTETATVSNAKYVRLDSSTKATYRPKTLFYNAHADGTVSTKKVENSDALENALPVALGRSRGIWRYDVIMKDLGEFYETSTLGRYAGDDPKSLTNGELDYACVYLVNIQKETLTCDFNKNCTDDCVTECKGPNCDVDICEGGNCTTDCLTVGCIYDSKDGSSIYSREVSLNNFLYNGTTAYNWDKTVNAKAEKTVSEIQNKADNVYNGVDENNDQPILSVTITPSSARDIRDKNDNNLSLRCESLTINGVEYTNTACFSRFIDDILDGDYNIVNEDNSYISDSNNRNTENYFTAWNGTIDDKQMLGPSWK